VNPSSLFSSIISSFCQCLIALRSLFACIFGSTLHVQCSEFCLCFTLKNILTCLLTWYRMQPNSHFWSVVDTYRPTSVIINFAKRHQSSFSLTNNSCINLTFIKQHSFHLYSFYLTGSLLFFAASILKRHSLHLGLLHCFQLVFDRLKTFSTHSNMLMSYSFIMRIPIAPFQSDYSLALPIVIGPENRGVHPP